MQRSTQGYNTKPQDYKASEYGKIHQTGKVHNYNNVREYGSTKEYKAREYKPKSLEYKPTTNNYLGRNQEKKVKRLQRPSSSIHGPSKIRKRAPDYRPAQVYKYLTKEMGPEYRLHQNLPLRKYETKEYRPQSYKINKRREYQYKEYRNRPENYRLTALNYYGFYDPRRDKNRPDILADTQPDIIKSSYRNPQKPGSADRVSVSDVKVHPNDENVFAGNQPFRHPPPGYQQQPQYGQTIMPAAVGVAAAGIYNTKKAPRQPLKETPGFKTYDNKYREYKGLHTYDKIHNYDHLHVYYLPDTGRKSRRPIRAAQAAEAAKDQKAKVAREQEQKESGIKMEPARQYDKVHQYDKIHDYQPKDYVPTQLNSTKLGNDKHSNVGNKTRAEPVKSVSGGPSAATMLMAGAAGGAVANRGTKPQTTQKESKASTKPQNTNNSSNNQPPQSNRSVIAPAAVAGGVIAGGAAAGYVAANNNSQPHQDPNKTSTKPNGQGKSKDHAFDDWGDSKKRAVPVAGAIAISDKSKSHNAKTAESKKQERKPQTPPKTPPQRSNNTRSESPPRNAHNAQPNPPNNYQPRYNDHINILPMAAAGAAGAAMAQQGNNRNDPQPTMIQESNKANEPEPINETNNNPPNNDQPSRNEGPDILPAVAAGATGATLAQQSNNRPDPQSKQAPPPSKPNQPKDDWLDRATPKKRPAFASAAPNMTDNTPAQQGLPPEVQAAIRAYDEAHSRKLSTPQVPNFKEPGPRVSRAGHAYNELPPDVVAKMHAYNRVRVF